MPGRTWRSSAAGCSLGLLDQASHGGRQLRTLAGPVGDAIDRHAQALFAAGSHRVVEAHALDEAAVAALTGVGDDEVVERALLRATTSQSNHDHDVSLIS